MPTRAVVPRLHLLVFVVSWLALSWYGMMAVHELGHVFGAVLTGGHIERVVLHPATISRTDVWPNPSPLVVVWLGPLLGCGIPVVVWLLVRRVKGWLNQLALFFAGFCLIANGAYISRGAFDRVGDCGVMLANGCPQWLLWAFGVLTIPTGLLAWHRLGSLSNFLTDAEGVDAPLAYGTLAVLAVYVAVQLSLSTW